MKRRSKMLFKRIWSWQKTTSEFLADRIAGLCLHVCAGLSTVGNVRLDLDLKTKPDVLGDMFWLPFRRECFDSVLVDPPWATPYHRRHIISYEARDVLKPGGRLVMRCPWFPQVKHLRLRELWVEGMNSRTPFLHPNVCLLAVCQKIQGQLVPGGANL